jgi:hypothetical protein
VGRLRTSDPYLDLAAPADTPRDHNDAGQVSHDDYFLAPSLKPGPVLHLLGYIAGLGDPAPFIANFAGLNALTCQPDSTAWLDGATIEAQIEAAILVRPRPAPSATPTATATETALPTPTVTATAGLSVTLTPTATLRATPTVSATLTPGATDEPTPTATDTPAPPSPTPLPSATESPTEAPSPTASATREPPPSPSATPEPSPPPTAAPAELCGQVLADGRPLAGVDVVLADDEDELARTRTDAQGAFCFRPLAPGVYSLWASAPGCRSATTFAEAGAGRTEARLSLRCPGRTVHLPLVVVGRPRARR